MSGDAGSTVTSNTGTGVGDVNIRVVPFSGKKDEWEDWKDKFMVKAAMNKYDGIINGDDKVPDTHDKDGVKKTLKPEEQTLVDLSKKGFYELVLSINHKTPEGKLAFDVVKGTKTTENPAGNLYDAVLRLDKRYQPRTATNLVQLTSAFHEKRLKKNQNPEDYINELESLKLRLGKLKHQITDKGIILHVLNTLTKEYDMEVKLLEHKMEMLENDNKELTIEEVRNDLNSKYEKLKVYAEKDKTSEPINHAYYMGTKFKGKCNWCGVIGHKATQCRLRIAGKPARTNFTGPGQNQEMADKGKTYKKRGDLYCTYCRTKGHDVSECRKKKREEKPTNPNPVMKNLACMAKEYKKPDKKKQACFGMCTNPKCEKIGPAYMPCQECGEGSGFIYNFRDDWNMNYETTDTDQRSVNSEDNIIYGESDDVKPSSTKIIKKEDADMESDNEGYREVEIPKFLKEFHPKFILPEWDEFRTIPIEDLFDEVHEHINNG